MLDDVSFAISRAAASGSPADRRGQDDAHQPAHALLRPDERRDPARRRRPARLPARRPPQPVRDRAAGAGALLDDDRREHRLRPARRPTTRRSSPRRGPRASHEFVEPLPDGYDTLVGERGMRSPGGERQRISLARAFLKDAPILILDEPTSSVDVETEARDHGRDGAPDGGPDDVHDRPPSEHAREPPCATCDSRLIAAESPTTRLSRPGGGERTAPARRRRNDGREPVRRHGVDAHADRRGPAPARARRVLLRDDVDVALRSAARREGF